MPLDEKELLERDSKRNIGEELLQSVRDIKSGRVGRVSTVEVSPLASARQKIGLSQCEFAEICSACHVAPYKNGNRDDELRQEQRNHSSP